MLPHRIKKILFVLDIIVLAGIIAHSIYRDIQLEKQYPGDLRNRIVGARLQKDGKSPYFYKWKSADGYRYADLQNDDSLKVSNITASPFYHDLLMPICDLPQRTISKIWMWFQYASLLIITFLFAGLAKNNYQKILVINIAIIFTCTEAWKSVIAGGQLYLSVALMIAFTIYGLLRGNKKLNIVLAAICSAVLVLSRPTAIFIYLPFILLYKKNYFFLLLAGFFLAAYGLFAVLNKKEKLYWIDYNAALKEQVKLHQGLGPALQNNERLLHFTRLEGFDFIEVMANYAKNPIPVDSENGNVFVLYKLLTHKKISIGALTILLLITVAILSAIFIFKRIDNMGQTVMFAFLLYMLADLFSPIYRHQYNTAQWLPLLLLAFILIEKLPAYIMVLILTGLALNITNITFIPMRHTIGEYIWLFTLSMLAFTAFPNNKKVRY